MWSAPAVLGSTAKPQLDRPHLQSLSWDSRRLWEMLLLYGSSPRWPKASVICGKVECVGGWRFRLMNGGPCRRAVWALHLTTAATPQLRSSGLKVACRRLISLQPLKPADGEECHISHTHTACCDLLGNCPEDALDCLIYFVFPLTLLVVCECPIQLQLSFRRVSTNWLKTLVF